VGFVTSRFGDERGAPAIRGAFDRALGRALSIGVRVAPSASLTRFSCNAASSAVGSFTRRAINGGLPESTGWRTRSDGTLEDARWWLKTARALAGVWREASLGGDPPSAWSAEQIWLPPRSRWPHFALALGAGLEPFRAHVEH